MRLLNSICLLALALSFARAQTVTPDEKNFTLQQRYWVLKSKAETYQDYKVIKEYLLDGVWKSALDSIKAQKLLVAEEKQISEKLKTDLQATNRTLAKEREASTQVVYDSNHISLLGIHFEKSVFVILIAVLFSLLILVGSVLITKIKLLQTTAKEKIVIADLVTREFEDFKKKAMDKQIKLARELQDERNKLADLRKSPVH